MYKSGTRKLTVLSTRKIILNQCTTTRSNGRVQVVLCNRRSWRFVKPSDSQPRLGRVEKMMCPEIINQNIQISFLITATGEICVKKVGLGRVKHAYGIENGGWCFINLGLISLFDLVDPLLEENPWRRFVRVALVSHNQTPTTTTMFSHTPRSEHVQLARECWPSLCEVGATAKGGALMVWYGLLMGWIWWRRVLVDRAFAWQ